MKKIDFERMESIEGGGCALAGEVVGAFWASGIGYAFGAISGGVGFAVGLGASLAVIGVCRYLVDSGQNNNSSTLA